MERTAGHEAARKEQEARGLLERQKLMNQKEAEKARSILYELRAQTSAVESTGQAKAEAQVRNPQPYVIHNFHMYNLISEM